MAKPKNMAERVAGNSKRSFRFNSSKLPKAVFRRVLFSIALIGTVYFSTKNLGVWKDIWPVNELVLEGEIKYLQEKVIIGFVNQQEVKGMLAIDLVELQKAATKIDWVDSVEIRKVWPQKLVFTIKEHLPVARVNRQILTQKGKLIEFEDRYEELLGLPLISMELGESENKEHLQKLWQEFRKIKRHFELLSLELVSLQIDKISNWHLSFAKGLTMKLGRKKRMDRVRRVVGIFAAIENKHMIKSIDLRYHNGLSIEWLQDKTVELEG